MGNAYDRKHKQGQFVHSELS